MFRVTGNSKYVFTGRYLRTKFVLAKIGSCENRQINKIVEPVPFLQETYV